MERSGERDSLKTRVRGMFVGNRYDTMETAGAFGDLGTLIPFVAGYIAILGMNPAAILFGFGLNKIAVGLFYRTPMAVQPMKAIGASAISQAGTITPGAIYGSTVVTAVIWIVLGITGAVDYVAKLLPKAVSRGIILGLGFSFIVEALRMMSTNPILAIAGLAVTFLLLGSKRLPAMFVLLLIGIAVTVIQQPDILTQLAATGIHPQLPTVGLPSFTWSDLFVATFVLALPQVPLSLGNACIAAVRENNEVFPDKPVTERKVATTMGLMNVLSTFLGGVPMCHGAGGMAGHVRFGARTGGALVILGVILVVMAALFADSVGLIFSLFPSAILGVILFFAGTELAQSARDTEPTKDYFYVLIVTAGVSMVNMGIALVAGILLYHLLKRGVVKL